MSNTHAPQAANQLLVSPYSTTVVSGDTPALDSRASKPSLLTMSRRTRSFRSWCHEKLTAPGTWPRSYRPGFTLTSTMRTCWLSRFCASHSVLTSGPAGMGVAASTAPPHTTMLPATQVRSQALQVERVEGLRGAVMGVLSKSVKRTCAGVQQVKGI